jgi:cytochrome b561
MGPSVQAGVHDARRPAALRLSHRGLAAMQTRFTPATVALHWFMLALLAAVYACIELRVLWPRGSDPRELIKTWHFMLGLSVLALVLIRIAARMAGGTPPIVPAPPACGSPR